MQDTDSDVRLLDLLVDGPTSFAALLRASRRFGPSADLTVSECLQAVRRLEEGGFVRTGFLDASGHWRAIRDVDWDETQRAFDDRPAHDVESDVALDSIGIWIALTDVGRSVWSDWSRRFGDEPDLWILDDSEQKRLLEIRAQSEEVAVRALTGWLADHPEKREVPDSRAIRPAAVFQLRDGSRILNGVLLTCRYDQHASAGTDSHG